MFLSNTFKFLIESEKPSLIIKIQNAKQQHTIQRYFKRYSLDLFADKRCCRINQLFVYLIPEIDPILAD